MDLPWQVEGVKFSSRGKFRGRGNFPSCALFGQIFPSVVLLLLEKSWEPHAGKPRQGSSSVPHGWSRAWRPQKQLPAETITEEMSRMTDSGSSSLVSKKRFLSLADFPSPWEEQPNSSTACSLTSQQPGGQSWKCPVAQHGVGLLLPKQPAWETLSHCLQAGEQAMKNPKQCQKKESEVPGRGPTQTSPIKTGANGTTQGM